MNPDKLLPTHPALRRGLPAGAPAVPGRAPGCERSPGRGAGRRSWARRHVLAGEAAARHAVAGRAPRWVVAPAHGSTRSRGCLALARTTTASRWPRAGRGTRLHWGSRPRARRRRARRSAGWIAIVAHEPDDLTVTVQAGVTPGALRAQLAPHRQLLPLDPPRAAGATRRRHRRHRGERAAARALRDDARSAARRALRGPARRHADVRGGAKVVKTVTGYDVPKLLVGALGTLGVVVATHLRLHAAAGGRGERRGLVRERRGRARRGSRRARRRRRGQPARAADGRRPGRRWPSPWPASRRRVRAQGARIEELCARAGGRRATHRRARRVVDRGDRAHLARGARRADAPDRRAGPPTSRRRSGASRRWRGPSSEPRPRWPNGVLAPGAVVPGTPAAPAGAAPRGSGDARRDVRRRARAAGRGRDALDVVGRRRAGARARCAGSRRSSIPPAILNPGRFVGGHLSDVDQPMRTDQAPAASAFDAIDPPDWESILDCVHCGICLPPCPTYRVLGQEMDSPRGRLYLMRAAAEGRIGLTENFVTHMDRCLGCRALRERVPVRRALRAAARDRSAGRSSARCRARSAAALLGRMVLGTFPERRPARPPARAPAPLPALGPAAARPARRPARAVPAPGRHGAAAPPHRRHGGAGDARAPGASRTVPRDGRAARRAACRRSSFPR